MPEAGSEGAPLPKSRVIVPSALMPPELPGRGMLPAATSCNAACISSSVPSDLSWSVSMTHFRTARSERVSRVLIRGEGRRTLEVRVLAWLQRRRSHPGLLPPLQSKYNEVRGQRTGRPGRKQVSPTHWHRCEDLLLLERQTGRHTDRQGLWSGPFVRRLVGRRRRSERESRRSRGVSRAAGKKQHTSRRTMLA